MICQFLTRPSILESGRSEFQKERGKDIYFYFINYLGLDELWPVLF
jgi:hypothetical protein